MNTADIATTTPAPLLPYSLCLACRKAGRRGDARGIYMRVTLSRLEEGLGHAGYACDKCGHRIKYVPNNEGR